LGNGDGTFQPYVPYAVGSQPADVVVSDFNKDGKLDLAVENNQSGTVSILLGNGDGTFQSQVPYSGGGVGIIGRMAIADFNGDGNTDIAITNPYSNNNSVCLLLGNGNGSFTVGPSYAVGSHQPLGVVAGQFNQGGIGSADMVLPDWDSYLGDTVTAMLNEAGTHVTLASSPNPSSYGQAVTFTVTVDPAVLGTGTPTGNVTFYNGQAAANVPPSLHNVIGTASLVNGVATLQYSNLPRGNNWITATYAGDTNFNPNSTRGLVQVVH
jgi:hypothetical protein